MLDTCFVHKHLVHTLIRGLNSFSELTKTFLVEVSTFCYSACSIFFSPVFFFIYSSSMIPLAFFASVFINTIQQAVNMGMLVFIIGLIFVSIVGKCVQYYVVVCVMFITSIGSQFILSQLYAHVEFVIYILSFLPPFQFVSAVSSCDLLRYSHKIMCTLRLKPSQTSVRRPVLLMA